MRLKKIFCGILCLCALLSVPMTGFAKQTKFINTLGFFNRQGIIYENVDLPDKTVTRENFALYLARIACPGFDNNEVKRYFTDVEKEGYSTKAINALTDNGIISVSSDGCFYPEREISGAEAAKMLVTMLGYGDIADMTGGFPNGYVKMAERIDILNVSKSTLTVEAAADMIFSALCADMCSADMGNGSIKFDKSDKTAFDVYLNMQYGTGTVTSANGGSLFAEQAGENRIELDGESYIYNSSDDMADYIGDYVGFVSTLDDDPEVIYLGDVPVRREKLVIAVSDICGITPSGVEYENERNAKKTVKLKETVILYNGSPLSENISETVSDLNEGNVVVKDRNNDGDYDTVLINDYKNAVISHIDSEKGVIYNKLDSSKKYDLDSFETSFLYNSQKELITAEEMSVGDVISVAESKNKESIRIYKYAEKITGTLKAVNNDDEYVFARIDDKEYRLDRSYSEYIGDKVKSGYYKVGNDYSVYIDMLGNISYIELSGGNMRYGYLLKHRYVNDVEDMLKLSILTAEDGVKVFNAAEKIIIDKERYKQFDYAENVLNNAPCDSNGEMVIRFMCNDSGEVTEIDTAQINYGKEDEKNSLSGVYDRKGGSHWVSSASNGMRLGVKAIVDSTTTVFYKPADITNPTYEDYWAKNGFVGVLDEIYTADVYTADAGTGVAECVVYYYSKNDGTGIMSHVPMMVSKVRIGLDIDNEVCSFVEGYQGTSKVTYTIPGDVDTGSIREGDLIYVQKTKSGKIHSPATTGNEAFKILYKAEDERPDDWVGGNLYFTGSAQYDNYRNDFQLSFGYVIEKINNVIKCSWNNDKNFDEINQLQKNIVIYDPSRSKGQRVYVGTVDKILDRNGSGGACSRLIVYTRGPSVISAFVYNRG